MLIVMHVALWKRDGDAFSSKRQFKSPKQKLPQPSDVFPGISHMAAATATA